MPKASAGITKGVSDRHDIVHRNGKSTDGIMGSWDVAQILALKGAVARYATEVEGMLKTLPGPPSPPEEPIQI